GGASNGHLLTGCICSNHEIAFSFNFSNGNRVRGATAVNCQYGVYLLRNSSNNEIDIYLEASNVVVDIDPDNVNITHPKFICIAQWGSHHNLIRYHDDDNKCSPPKGEGFYSPQGAPGNVAVVLGTGSNLVAASYEAAPDPLVLILDGRRRIAVAPGFDPETL